MLKIIPILECSTQRPFSVKCRSVPEIVLPTFILSPLFIRMCDGAFRWLSNSFQEYVQYLLHKPFAWLYKNADTRTRHFAACLLTANCEVKKGEWKFSSKEVVNNKALFAMVKLYLLRNEGRSGGTLLRKGLIPYYPVAKVWNIGRVGAETISWELGWII